MLFRVIVYIGRFEYLFLDNVDWKFVILISWKLVEVRMYIIIMSKILKK